MTPKGWFPSRLPLGKGIALLVCVSLLPGCAGTSLEDCPEGQVRGKDVVRLRTSHYRVELESTSAAAVRVFPYALMSAFAYQSGEHCADYEKDTGDAPAMITPKGKKVAPAKYRTILNWLTTPTKQWPAWTRTTIPDLELPGNCEDGIGMMYNVWEREENARTYVVIAFRGTSGFNDYVHGNFWWFLRFLPNQYDGARQAADKIIKAYEDREKAAGRKPPIVLTTGHSLGGGLAQHVLYTHPRQVLQAIVFDPSPVTAYWAASKADQIAGCDCDAAGKLPEPESRILRVYHSYELLSDVRWFHKVFFKPERHVQELRFPYKSGLNPIARHSMKTLAQALYDEIAPMNGEPIRKDWYAAKGTEGEISCTRKVIEHQRNACAAPAGDWIGRFCPG